MKQLKTQNLQNKLRNKFLKSGVKMIGPDTIYFSKDTKIGKNVTIEPFVVFGLKVKVGRIRFSGKKRFRGLTEIEEMQRMKHSDYFGVSLGSV